MKIPERGIAELVARQVAAAPDRCAVHDPGKRSLSYAGLWDEAGTLAAELAELGVGPGDGVVVAAGRGVELVVAMLAVARCGAWYMLPDSLWPPTMRQAVAADTGAKAVIEVGGPQSWPSSGIPHRLTLPPADRARVPAPAGTAAGQEDALYVAYTSGSTGRPKGVIASQRAVCNFVAGTRLCRILPGDCVALQSSLTCDAITLEVWSTLTAGGTIVVLPQVADLGLDEWLDVIEEQRIRHMFLMAPLFEMVAQENPAAFGSLTTLIFGGQAANPAVVLRVCREGPPARLVLGYGPTEATVFATRYVCTPESVAGRTAIPLGTPLENYEIRLLGTDARPVRPGEVGEIYIGGPGVATGYLNRPDLTEERFVRFGSRVLYRSGDLARRFADGALEFVARTDRQVKIRGYRVEPDEVERVILGSGLVRACVVECVNDRQPVHLACFFVPSGRPAESDAIAVELAQAVARDLPGYMVPARWIRRDVLPLTANGKFDRARLLGEYPGQQAAGATESLTASSVARG